MEVKEKANRIIEMFKKQIASLPLTNEPTKKEIREYHYGYKQCALMAVNEIIELDIWKCDCIREVNPPKYWNEVRKEIEKL